jgi:hypothetical protein
MKRHPMFALSIDTHGNAGDGIDGRYGTCTECGRSNKVVGRESSHCVMPRMVAALPADQRPASGCDAQRGPRPIGRNR